MKNNCFLNKDSHIRPFNPGWWLYFVLTVVFMFMLTIVANRYDRQTRLNIVFVLSVFETIVMRVYKRSLKTYRNDYNYFNELPCYLCNQSTLLCVLASYLDNSHIMAFCFVIGYIGELLAIFAPDSYNINQAFYSRQALGFYGYHCLLLVTCLSFYTLKLYNPNPKDTLWITILLFMLVALAHIINYLLRKSRLNEKSNYIFTFHPDNALLEKLYKLFFR